MPTIKLTVGKEIAIVHEGVAVYHTYKNSELGERSTFWFTTQPLEADGELEFRIESLAGAMGGIDLQQFTSDLIYKTPGGLEMRDRVLRYAIDNDLIPLAEKPGKEKTYNVIIERVSVEYTYGRVVKARTKGEAYAKALSELDTDDDCLWHPGEDYYSFGDGDSVEEEEA